MFTILTNAGRATLASLLQNQSLFMAFGVGHDYWETDREVVASFDAISNEIDLGYVNVSNVRVFTTDPEAPTEFTAGVDFTANLPDGIVTRIPAGSIGAESVRVTFHVNATPPNPASTALIEELARKEILNKQFVTPDVNGEVIVPGGRFAYSATPTRYLFLSCTLLESELPTSTIRELGIFIDPTFATSPDAGQVLFGPEYFSDIGTMLTLRHYPAIVRNEASRETFSLVIPL